MFPKACHTWLDIVAAQARKFTRYLSVCAALTDNNVGYRELVVHREGEVARMLVVDVVGRIVFRRNGARPAGVDRVVLAILPINPSGSRR